MQRLEISGAVRPIYGSLGVKRLNPPIHLLPMLRMSGVIPPLLHMPSWNGHRNNYIFVNSENINTKCCILKIYIKKDPTDAILSPRSVRC